MFILGLIIGAAIGMMCMALCAIGKENDEINRIQTGFKTTYLDDLKMANYKYTLETILINDINFYRKMYQKNRNTYYFGRIDQCKFLLNIVRGKSKDEEC